METIISRYRNLSILVVVLFLQVLGLAIQIKRPADPQNPDGASSRLIRLWVVSAITPVEKGFVATGQWVRGLWSGYIDLRDVRRQNLELKQQMDRLRLEQVRLSEDAGQARRLQALLDFKEQFVAATVAAQVIGSSGSQISRVIYIDKGAKHGIQVNMPVITPDGIVGKVIRVFSTSSQVLVVNDQTSGVGAILERTRLQGILKGTPSGNVMLEYIMNGEKIEPGDVVLTSGGERIFPKGLPVGKVVQVGHGEIFQNIRLQPAADLNRLEEVLVVTRVDEREPEAGAVSSTRAADILAERLPKVPRKPETEPPTKTASAPAVAQRTRRAAPPVELQSSPAAVTSAPIPNEQTPVTQEASAGTTEEPQPSSTGEPPGSAKPASEPPASVPPAIPPPSQSPGVRR